MADQIAREAKVGAIAVAVFLGAVAVAARSSAPDIEETVDAIAVTAEFGRIDGLAVGSPVRFAGLDIGEVAKVWLTDQRRAQVSLIIRNTDIEIPTDSAAVIETDGIFGEKYVEIHPGGELDAIEDGDRLSYSQDSVVLESLLNQIVARARSARAQDADTVQ
jgi:phospholipid/cholesterol/gamma-HCH transport system substrate-binding protein